MNRHTQIIATIGPACCNEAMLLKMVERGMNVIRINFSHGTEKQHQGMINLIRQVNQRHKKDIKILQDLAGYRIRIGDLKRRRMLLKDQVISMSSKHKETDDTIPFDYMGDLKIIKKGSPVFIDDGRLMLKVIAHTEGKLKMKVVQGGLLKERKGINIPTVKLQSNIMTDQDQKDLAFGIKNQFDYIAQSFVRNRKDIQRVVDLVRPVLPNCKIIAKIESEEGVRNIDSIVEECDGVMVARGDLGVTMPLYKIPIIQKYIIRHCNRKKKISITATQMLESMIENGRPTRAEVSDVANAILDGSDFVMLSGETAVGKYPSRSVQLMSHIIEYTERYDYHPF
jgi:pyruvate kinase